MYVLMNPLKPETADNSLPKEITWEYAQKEIAQVKGFATGSAGLSKGNTNRPISKIYIPQLLFGIKIESITVTVGFLLIHHSKYCVHEIELL